MQDVIEQRHSAIYRYEAGKSVGYFFSQGQKDERRSLGYQEIIE
jgi:hypothetical protein